jgi:alpha-tubulin suppressor-like RCC1 family protein
MLRILFVVMVSVVFNAAAFGTGISSGEKGARSHLTRLATGGGHACAIMDDGTVWCWGDNSHGQLGDGPNSFSPRTSPVEVHNSLGAAVSVATGFLHSCAIMINSGAVSCWGDNDNGQLGNGTITTSLISTPVTVKSLINVISLAGGDDHTCGVRADGTVWCWGGNSVGQLGTGTSNSLSRSSVPVQVLLTGAVSVSAGDRHTCALRADGIVECWGDNSSGQLGRDTGQNPSAKPMPTLPLSSTPGVRAIEISAAGFSTCALLSDSSVSCWGLNDSGQLGNGGFQSGFTPSPSALPSSVVALGGGLSHTCAILAGGSVVCWGDGIEGQLGNSGFGNQPLPVAALGVAGAVEISSGGEFTCARLVNGGIRCWGYNGDGEHGDGTTAPAGTDSVGGIAETFLGRSVSTGNQFTCARRGRGDAACWGAGTSGQLGNSANNSSPNPVAVFGLNQVIAISAGNGAHACAVDLAAGAQCWGDNSRGQLGNLTNTSTNQPVPVFTNGLQFVAISAGDLHTCAIATGGTVWCWGAGDNGQLGTGGFFDANFPQQVSGVQNAVAVSAGNKYNCALTADGTVRCWGDNSLDQLGDGGAELNAVVPVAVPSLSSIVALAAGADHVCALPVNGSLQCWGANFSGQIGNNSTTKVPFHVSVQGLPSGSAVTVSAGYAYSCTAVDRGFAYCWGGNLEGELSTTDTAAAHLTATPVVRDDTNS